MTISDEAVEAAAKSLWDIDREHNDREYEDCREATKRHLRREARAALEAAAPFIRAQVLEDAAQALPFMDRPVTRLIRHVAVVGWLRARAAAERGGE